jgi:hypothetical protein
MFGVNQAECCSGETAETGPLTAEVASIDVTAHTPPPPATTTSAPKPKPKAKPKLKPKTRKRA